MSKDVNKCQKMSKIWTLSYTSPYHYIQLPRTTRSINRWAVLRRTGVQQLRLSHMASRLHLTQCWRAFGYWFGWNRVPYPQIHLLNNLFPQLYHFDPFWGYTGIPVYPTLKHTQMVGDFEYESIYGGYWYPRPAEWSATVPQEVGKITMNSSEH